MPTMKAKINYSDKNKHQYYLNILEKIRLCRIFSIPASKYSKNNFAFYVYIPTDYTSFTIREFHVF